MPSKQMKLVFVGHRAGEEVPDVALFRMQPGKPPERVATSEGGVLNVDPDALKGARLALAAAGDEGLASALKFRADTVLERWLAEGIVIPRERWELLLFERVCTSGRVRKCRPWWVDLMPAVRPKLGVVARLPLQRAASLSETGIIFPFRCLPLCEGVVEVYERRCCCPHFHYTDFLDRLREALRDIPVLVRWPEPPIPDPGPLGGQGILAGAALVARRRGSRAALNPQPLPPGPAELMKTFPRQRLWEDFQAVQKIRPEQLESFVAARPYLSAYFCRCTVRKVGETEIQPGGEFDFCYRRPRRFHHLGERCWTVFAFKVRQQIGSSWVTVYDGVAGNDWFAAGEEADIRTSHPAAQPCGDGPPPPDEGDGTPFVMLEHVTAPSTHHFNFPAQVALSDLGAPDADDGLIDFGGVPDCPWGGALGLRLWVSPTLEGVVAFYRLSVVRTNTAGNAIAAPVTLDSPVAWRRYVTVAGQVETTSTGLAAAPADVGGETGLFRVPYWSGGMDWLSGQFHQVWNTADFANGRYLLLLELFGPGGQRIKPNGAPAGDPGVARPFQLRRWTSDTVTANVPFADCAHLFWIDNRAVDGEIVDLRKDTMANSSQCQFLSGSAGTDISVGFRAYHVNGVTTSASPVDDNSFMAGYTLSWQRGLNGPTGLFETGTIDKGEGGAAPSDPLDLGFLLGPHPAPPATPLFPAQERCTFSVHLHVNAKHTTGGAFIDAYDYHETASFALQLTS